MTGDTVELEYNGRELTFREDLDQWHCSALALKSKSLSALKRNVDKVDGEARRVSVPCYRLVSYMERAEPCDIVMVAKRSDWELRRHDEKPAAQFATNSDDRRVPSVWVMTRDGNHAPTRHKVRLDECFFPTESNLLALKEAARIDEETKRLETERTAIIAGIPRLSVDDLTPKGVKEEDLGE